jgi:head-tail adaptor
MAFGAIIQKRTPTLFAGRLRHKIDLVKVSNVQDSTGGFNLSIDVVYANVWASIEALSGMEKFAAHEFISQVSHQVVIRYIGAAPS